MSYQLVAVMVHGHPWTVGVEPQHDRPTERNNRPWHGGTGQMSTQNQGSGLLRVTTVILFLSRAGSQVRGMYIELLIVSNQAQLSPNNHFRLVHLQVCGNLRNPIPVISTWRIVIFPSVKDWYHSESSTKNGFWPILIGVKPVASIYLPAKIVDPFNYLGLSEI